MATPPLALFLGAPGLTLTSDEVAFFRETNPLGLFLFARNLDTPDQIRALVAQFREAVGREDAPVFVDQEGGRIQRLDRTRFPLFRPQGDFGKLAAQNLDAAKTALTLSMQAMGTMLADLDIGSGTSPVVDLGLPEQHDVIGDRAFAADPELVSTLGRVASEALLSVGAMPIVKHIPGYGRVTVDPHHECPFVDAPLEALLDTDFKPFVALRDMPWTMVAHLVFKALDPDLPASVSPTVATFIRDRLGYDGAIITDCLTMEALSGTWAERVTATLDAGYDIALVSHGDLAEREAVARAARPLTEASTTRIARADARLGTARVAIDTALAEVEAIFAKSGLA